MPYCPPERDHVTIKVSAVKYIISLIESGELETVIECLESVIDPEFRKQVRATKEMLYWDMRGAKTASEYEKCKKIYDEFMENSLF